MLTSTTTSPSIIPSLNLSTTLPHRSLSPNILASLITTSKNIIHLLQTHEAVIRHGLDSHRVINFKLQRSYSALGRLDYSVSLFNRTQNPNVFLYTNIIHSHITSNLQQTGLHFYVQMLTDGVEPNEFTLSAVLKACSIEDGKSVHCQAIKLGFDSCSYVRTALVDIYSKGGDVVSARHLFDTMTDLLGPAHDSGGSGIRFAACYGVQYCSWVAVFIYGFVKQNGYACKVKIRRISRFSQR